MLFQRFFRNVLVLAFLTCAILVLEHGAAAAQGSWLSLGKMPFSVLNVKGIGGAVDCIYFSDTLHGVVCFWNIAGAGAAPVEEIYFTSNKRAWKSSNIPDGIHGIRAIRPINGKLYAATDGPDLLVSTDLGANWTLSGLGFANAYDVFSDRNNQIHALIDSNHSGHCCFTRLDRLHCLRSGGSLSSFAQVSSDGGITWSDTDVPSAGGLCYGDSINALLFIIGSDFHLYRSSDLGKSWQDIRSDLFYPSYLEGNNGVIYCSGGSGGLRSTDYGLTWTSTDGAQIGLAGNGYCHHCPVFGPMGNIMVVPKGNEIFMSLTGGDGSLISPINFDFRYSADTARFATGDPIESGQDIVALSTCPGVRLPIPLASGVDSLRVSIEVLKDSLHEFSLQGSSTFTLVSGKMDTAWLVYTPHVQPGAGITSFVVHNQWRGQRWDDKRAVIVNSLPALGVVSADTIRGASCTVHGEAKVIADSCQFLVLTEVSSSLPQRFSFENSLPDTIGIAINNKLQFKLDLKDTNNLGEVTLTLRGHFLGTTIPFDTTFSIFYEGNTLDAINESSRGNSMESNFPNPLCAATAFQTNVPFSTFRAGTARITITDAKGTVVKESEFAVEGEGAHQFKLSAETLATGTYCYTIEFPRGVVIGQKHILVLR